MLFHYRARWIDSNKNLHTGHFNIYNRIYKIEYIKSNQSCEDVCTKGSSSRMSFIRIYVTFFTGNLVTSIVSEFDDSERKIISRQSH